MRSVSERSGEPVLEIPVPYRKDEAPGDGGADRVVGALVAFAALAVYVVTLAPNVSFWDSGEFIAASHILGVPHPPGTPLYVLIGRIFAAAAAAGTVPVRVNLLSAIPGALAVLFLYLSLLSIGRPMLPRDRDRTDRTLLRVGAAAGSLLAAVGSTCWANAIEAEVYALSLFAITFCLWILLRWQERGNTTDRTPILLVSYVLALSIGVHLGTYLALPAFTLFLFAVDRRIFRDSRLIVLVFFFTLLGLTVHFFLPVRSFLNPAIDEANPETRQAFFDFLLRKQYKPNNPLIRQADWSFQFRMYWGYFREQYGAVIPLLGVAGMVFHFRRARKTFPLYGVLFLITSFFLIFYMNFTDHEVRERDYFFAPSFFLWGGWAGLGGAFLIRWLREKGKRLGIPEKPVLLVLSFLLLAIPVSVAARHWHSHDRRGNLIAHDYAQNILTALGPDAILFTNGDNDTFPLWYIQEVEGVRKDVRVVNLALLNTPWYIWQLKHLDPKVPFGYTDREIEELRPYRTREGEIVYVKDLAIRELVNENDWKRPIYFAVTIADLMGLDEQKRLGLEGLVFRLTREEREQLVDVAKCEENLWSVYRYRGILDESGHLDAKISRNANQKKLISNYSAAFSRLAVQQRNDGNYEEAIRAMEMAGRITPGYRVYEALMGPLYIEAKRYDDAESLFTRQQRQDPDSLPPLLSLAYLSEKRGDPDGARRWYRRGVEIAPEAQESHLRFCRFLIEQGDYEEAREVLVRWLKISPGDRSAVAQLAELDRAMHEAPRFVVPGDE